MPRYPRPDEDPLAQDKELICNDANWPRYPILPLINHTGEGMLPETGFMVAGYGMTVFSGNLFALESPLNLSGMDRKVYHNADALLAAGWRVD